MSVQELIERLEKAALIQWQNSPSIGSFSMLDDLPKFMESEAAKTLQSLHDQNIKLIGALEAIAKYYEQQYKEGDIGYQAVIVARKALNDG